MKGYLKDLKRDIKREFKFNFEIIPNEKMVNHVIKKIKNETHIINTEKYMYVDVVMAVRETVHYALKQTFGGE